MAARKHVAVVAAGQSAIARQDQEQRPRDRIAPHQQAVRDLLGRLAQVGDQLGDLARVSLGLGGAVQRLAEPVGGDQLHRPRDLADVLDRLAAFDDRSGFGHVCSLAQRRSGFSLTPDQVSTSIVRLKPDLRRASDQVSVVRSLSGRSLTYAEIRPVSPKMSLELGDRAREVGLDLVGHLLLALERGADLGFALAR